METSLSPLHCNRHGPASPIADPLPNNVDDGGANRKCDEEEVHGSSDSVDDALEDGGTDWIGVMVEEGGGCGPVGTRHHRGRGGW
jgi:hypothetical protein